jgi:hypothetical protein
LLAYVFHHRPAPSADRVAYEGLLRGFHAELQRGTIDGFIRSASYRVDDEYDDWYLVASSAALDELNRAAITGARATPHDAAARLAAGGFGKLLRLVAGEADLDARRETGFAKPAGMAYAELYRRLERSTELPGVSLWQRMMVLGPDPEFCLLSPADVELPSDLRPEGRSRRRV